MPRFDDRTAMGGTKTAFGTTSWTKILDSNTSDKERQGLIINELLDRYWKPVYCYLRRKGYDNEKAKDLTQGFFYEVVLGRNLLKQADQEKGKFRTFLLTALDNYTIDIHRHETSGKRPPSSQIMTLEDYDIPIIPGISPEQGFNYAWVSELLDKVLIQVEKTCRAAGQATHWEIFCVRVLEPIMNDSKPVPLPDLCKKYGIESESKASNMHITVKRRLRKAIEQQLKQMGQSDSGLEEEIAELLSIFAN